MNKRLENNFSICLIIDKKNHFYRYNR